MYPWRQWPIQIGSALSHFHEAGWAHMDIKPSNVVRDAEGNSILIDISGIGGITHAWRALLKFGRRLRPLNFHLTRVG
ncbi:hypothetical protein BDV39DRAFT_175904 [Aspergillus sergii]|uniref:Protein kinase domain-containing protein n=1 Tax=Aspergillus sergii TaxID=1034303 RepID=A0A5N6X2M2_9EURO|nr:hypothetical protein BDV39DRAFT_175904 [Aspergillus sergii]